MVNYFRHQKYIMKPIAIESHLTVLVVVLTCRARQHWMKSSKQTAVFPLVRSNFLQYKTVRGIREMERSHSHLSNRAYTGGLRL